MRGVDHDALGFWAAARERFEDAVEDAEPAPADEAVVERLMRAIAERRVLPLQAVADHIDDAADNPAGRRLAACRETTENKEKSAPSGARSIGTDESSQASPSMETLNHASVNRS